MFVIRHKWIFFSLSIALILFSIGSLFVVGLRQGIEFTGGSLLEVSYTNTRPDIATVQEALKDTSIGTAVVQPSGDSEYIIRTRFLNEEERASALEALSIGGTQQVKQESFSSIGPSISSELKTKALWAIIAIVITVILFIAFAFRKVSRPVSSWVYGSAAILALVHDLVIGAGVYAFAAQFYAWEADVLFVIALLAILGLSVNDTIVVFDRIRESLHENETHHVHEPFDDTVGRSITQTATRSINTSVTVLLTLAALFFFGAESTRNFAFALGVGMIIGTYSSVFLASPLLVLYNNWQTKKKA